MNRKTTLIFAFALLLTGIAAFALLRAVDDAEPDADAAPGQSSAASSPSGLAPAAGKSPAPARSERELRDAELAARYGEARTNLSRHISGNVASLLDDAVAMGEMMTGGNAGAFGGGRMGSRAALRGLDLDLDDEQRARVDELYKEFQKREIERTRGTVGGLRKDPTALMELLLAGDSHARGETSEEDYQAFQLANADRLKDIINPLDRTNFEGGRPLEDPGFRRDIEAILDADQAERFSTTMQERAAEAEANPRDSSITNIPAMELESLDQAVESAGKMTSGFRQIMEGMGNLQELGPLIEGQMRPRNQ